MKRILLITIDFPPRDGGVARYLGGLAKYWRDQLFVMAPKEAGTAEFDSTCGYTVIRQNLMFKYLWPKWLKMLWWTVRYIKEYDQLWVSHVLPVGTVALIMKIVFRKEYVVFLHGMDFEMAKTRNRKRRIMKLVLSQAKLVVTNSRALENSVKNFTKTETLVVYPTIKTELFDNYKHKDSKDLTVLLTVGRLVGRKGHYRVLDSMAELIRDGKDNLVYLIVGSGMEYSSLIRYVNKLGLEKHVRFYTDVPDQNLIKYYSAADIFVMPTEPLGADIEGFGMVYHEAGYAGLPVIASNLPGVDEAVLNEQTGILVEAGNVLEIKAAIVNLINHPELGEKLGQAARERIEKEFTLEVQAEKLKPYL